METRRVAGWGRAPARITTRQESSALAGGYGGTPSPDGDNLAMSQRAINIRQPGYEGTDAMSMDSARGAVGGLPRRRAVAFIVLLGTISLFADMTYECARGITGPHLGLL